LVAVRIGESENRSRIIHTDENASALPTIEKAHDHTFERISELAFVFKVLGFGMHVVA
jgi:hypothetical protein